jgi:glycerophosphoryl diester phosphodiesterase
MFIPKFLMQKGINCECMLWIKQKLYKKDIKMKWIYSIIICCFIVSCKTIQQPEKTLDMPAFDKQGHRGSRGLMPENTIPAMLKAIDLNVTTLELDVVISGDGKVVVSHDHHFHENITTTPEKNSLTKTDAATRLLYKMSYDSIKKYDVGILPHPDFPRQQKIPVYKPLLSDLIKASEEHARSKGRTMFYNIEIKSSAGNDGIKHPPIQDFADKVLEVIIQSGIYSRTTVQSFDPRALQAVRTSHPSTILSLLIENTDKRGLDEQLRELGFIPQVYSPHFLQLNKELIAACRQKNMKVIPWTINTLEVMKLLKEMGVDGIITDYPDLFAQLD